MAPHGAAPVHKLRVERSAVQPAPIPVTARAPYLARDLCAMHLRPSTAPGFGAESLLAGVAPVGSRSPAVERFRQSTSLSYDQWRDGEGFDLTAFEGMTPAESAEVLAILTERLEHSGAGWREVESVAALGTAAADQLLLELVEHPAAEVRLRATRILAARGDPAPSEREIVRRLRDAEAAGGIDALMRMAEEHPSPEVLAALRFCAVDGAQDYRVHAAALLLFLEGGAEESFDWNHRPLFLQFGEKDRAVRVDAMSRLEALMAERGR